MDDAVFQEEKESSDTCPYLGFQHDPTTAMAFPSLQNYCHRTRTPRSPNSLHQREFCLSPNHRDCPVFSGVDVKTGHLFHKNTKSLPRIRIQSGYILLTLVVILMAGFFGLLRFGLIQLPAIPEFLPTETLTTPPGTPLLAIEMPTYTATATFTVTVTRTPLPPSATPTPILPHLLETPIGPIGRDFIIHRVTPGESSQLLADIYFTTPGAIQAVNYQMGTSLWDGLLLVIPYMHRSVRDIAPMSVYEVTVEGITFETLSRQYNTDLDTILEYNQRPLDYNPKVGEYVLIPYPQLLTPTPSPW